MYHYSWWVLKRFWLLGCVNWPFKSKLHCLPRQHLFFFFLTTDPQPGGYFNITPHSNLANVIILGVEYLANNADLLTSLPHRHAQWNQKPGIIYEGQKNLSFHFFKKERWLNKEQPYANRPPPHQKKKIGKYSVCPHCHSLKRVKH